MRPAPRGPCNVLARWLALRQPSCPVARQPAMTQRGYQARTRHVFTQERFNVEFANVPTTRGSPVTRIRHALGRKWNKRRVKSRLLGWFPIVTWVREYDLRHDLLPDLLTGVTLAVFHVPQSEYARSFRSVYFTDIDYTSFHIKGWFTHLRLLATGEA